MWQNSPTQKVTTPKLKMWQNSQTQNVFVSGQRFAITWYFIPSWSKNHRCLVDILLFYPHLHLLTTLTRISQVIWVFVEPHPIDVDLYSAGQWKMFQCTQYNMFSPVKVVQTHTDISTVFGFMASCSKPFYC